MSHDVIVLGAGPAGSVVARRLAASGVRVALVGAPSCGGWEGLSVRSRGLFAEEGFGEHAGLLEGPFRRGGGWAGRPVEGSEWLVERRLLAAALRADARAAGAHVLADLAVGVEWADGGWRVHLRSDRRLTSRLLIEARGRRGPERRGPLLLAVGQPFRRPAVRRPAPPGTQIHAADFGWCWLADQGQSLWVQVVARPGTGHPASWIRAAAAQIPALEFALAEANPAGACVSRPAHARLGLPGVALLRGRDVTLWRTGDAAYALDPLSGQGVYEALRGARLVATAVRSVLDGSDAALAHRFVRERHEDAWHGGIEAAAGFYREEAARRAAGAACGMFWADTAAAYRRLLPATTPVAAAIERRPVLDQGRIVEREVVVTADRPRGVWHVAGVPLVSLKRFLDAGGLATVETAATAMNKPPDAVASAIHWLQQTGIVGRPAPHSVSSGG